MFILRQRIARHRSCNRQREPEVSVSPSSLAYSLEPTRPRMSTRMLACKLHLIVPLAHDLPLFFLLLYNRPVYSPSHIWHEEVLLEGRTLAMLTTSVSCVRNLCFDGRHSAHPTGEDQSRYSSSNSLHQMGSLATCNQSHLLRESFFHRSWWACKTFSTPSMRQLEHASMPYLGL